ncbi:unnamed protein product [Rangifer tarandus platyrhynchus]|uniref:Uncharacterized protein n=1 Tax=Rangifer tarandus platyrhynchus TaxID=3082113 RepID=A0AC59YW43_RANTA
MRILFCPKAGNLRSSSCTLTSTAPWLWLMHKTLTHQECKFINLWILHTVFPPETQLKYVLCCFAFSQKQALSQGFKCRQFTWEVIPGDTSGEQESQTGKRGK